MAFPTTSQLTDFSGGSETPISEGGTWVSTGGACVGGSSPNRDGSGHMTLGVHFEMARAETVGPQFEVWATLNVVAGGFWQLYMRSGTDHYRVDIDGSGIWRFYKTSDVQIGSDLATQAISNGDAIGFEYVGGTLRAYRKPAAGSWGQVGTDRTDALLASSTGNLQLAMPSDTQVDNFGGGTVSSVPDNPITPRTTVFKE